MDPAKHARDVERWRTRRLARLTAADGWLSLVGLEWLHDGENTIGSDPSSDVRLPGDAPSRLGAIRVDDDGVTARFEHPGVTHAGEPVTSMALDDDSDGDPTIVELGGLSFHLIRRAGRLAVRIRDRDLSSSHALDVDYFPIDSRWRVEATFEAFDPPHGASVPNVLGFEEPMVIPGALDFELKGAPLCLQAFREAGTQHLFIVFGDATNGDETYGGGRYLYAPPPRRGRTVVDFNKAYNPPCVFTPFATCVLPLPENRLPVRVEAGEKRYR
jgi:uncharacterized protein (DUF1684 family)